MSLHYTNERATEHCAQMTLSNLVKLSGAPDVDRSYHESTTSSKPPSRNQRQLIAEKGSFDGGSLSLRDNLELSHAAAVTGIYSCRCVWRLIALRMPDKISRAWATFRAALTERRINVDRVSISGLPYYKSRAKRLLIVPAANNIAPVTIRETASCVSVRRSSNADSYNRCFRYLDCFRKGECFPGISNGAGQIRACRVGGTSNLLGRIRLSVGIRPPFTKAVYLSNQLDRKTDCYRNGIRATYRKMVVVGENVNLLESVKRPQNSVLRVGRYLSHIMAKRRCGNGVSFTVAVCGTQTKQGGCLYEQPCSQI